MTRIQLYTIAKSVMNAPVDVSALKRGYLYTGLYLKRPMMIYADDSRIPLAVIYKRVYYAFQEHSAREAGTRRYLQSEFNCTTIVNLYTPHNYIFKDAEGEYRERRDFAINRTNDYSQLIPIPFKM